eukprot:1183571-Prorocentrum_minimum.AAC.2
MSRPLTCARSEHMFGIGMQVYGACIQCTVAGCYASYHPLCGRRAGYRMHVRKEAQPMCERREKSLTMHERLAQVRRRY